MARSYAQHGFVAPLSRRARRRGGPADLRALEGRMAEQVRAGIIADLDCEEAVSTALGAIAELIRGEVAVLAAIDQGIKAYLRENPRRMATLHGYRAPKVKPPAKTLSQWLREGGVTRRTDGTSAYCAGRPRGREAHPTAEISPAVNLECLAPQNMEGENHGWQPCKFIAGLNEEL